MDLTELRSLLGKQGTAKSTTNPAGIYTGEVIQVHIDGFIWIRPTRASYEVACDPETFKEEEITTA